MTSSTCSPSTDAPYLADGAIAPLTSGTIPHAPHAVVLSPRELQVAGLIAQGLPNKCIGRSLGISPWTVATHVKRVFGKLGVTSRAEMVGVLVRLGVL